jgi:hypothetical protein
MDNWLNYLIRQDFTEMGELLEAIPLGPLDESNQRFIASCLAEYGPEEGKDKWNLEEAIFEFSLFGTEVTYNGLNSTSLPTLSLFKRTLCLTFPERSTAPVGRLYLCWNEPAVEAPAETDSVEE